MIEERLLEVAEKPLDKGSHRDIAKGMCVMEAVSYVAGEPWSDHPECVCPVIATFLRTWNDAMSDDDRTGLLSPLIPLVIGSRSNDEIERRRAVMAGDWMIRMHTPAWLRLAGLTDQATSLESMPEITDFIQIPSLMPTLNAVRKDAAAAWDAARVAARVAAKDAAWDAARDAAWDAAWAAARAAAWAAAWAAARAAARAAAWDAVRAAAWDAARAAARVAARAAAWDAARAAAWASLTPTVSALQISALTLVHRMLEIRA